MSALAPGRTFLTRDPAGRTLVVERGKCLRLTKKPARADDSAYVTERLEPYVVGSPKEIDGVTAPALPGAEAEVLDELMQRAVLLLAVMPRNQRREAIEEIISPHELDRGRRAIDALIRSGYVAVDEAGRLLRLH